MLAWLGQISAPQRADWLLLLCPSHLESPKIDPDIQQVFRYTKIASHQEMAIIPHTFLFLYFLRVLYCHWVSQWRPVCFLVWSGHFLWSCSLYLQPLYDCVFLGPGLPILPQKMCLYSHFPQHTCIPLAGSCSTIFHSCVNQFRTLVLNLWSWKTATEIAEHVSHEVPCEDRPETTGLPTPSQPHSALPICSSHIHTFKNCVRTAECSPAFIP